ncbi:MAG: TolC family protein [bacterium]|nr:TolC family protein [bacterium]
MPKTNIFLLILLISSVPGRAELDFALTTPDSALSAALATLGGTPLTVADATAKALENSYLMRDAWASLEAARGSLARENGEFDPELFGEFSTASEKQPSASPFTGAAVLHPETSRGQVGGRVTLPIGTKVEASIVGSRYESNSAFASLNPQYDATGSLRFAQPLLEGFGPAKWGQRGQAKRSYAAAKLRYEQAQEVARATAEAAYWDLYAAERDLAVALVTKELAEALLREAEIRFNAGLAGPNHVNTARVFLAEQELNEMDAQDNLTRVSDVLATFIGARPDGQTRYRTVEEPERIAAVESEDAVVERALAGNRELKATQEEAKAMQSLARAASWNALPQLDLFGALGGNGIAGTGRDVVFGSDTLRNNLDTGFSDALDQAIGRDYPSWALGLRLTVPILPRGKFGERDRMRAEAARAEHRRAQTQRVVEEQVRATHRELFKAQERLAMAETGVSASYDQVRIGLIEYKGGATSAFELVRLAADLVNAQRRYSATLVRTAKSAATMRVLAP